MKPNVIRDCPPGQRQGNKAGPDRRALIRNKLKYTMLCGLVLFLFSRYSLFSQNDKDTIKHWKFNGSSALNFSQVALSNWAAGGENSIAGYAIFITRMLFSKNKLSWESNLDVGYGQISQRLTDGNRYWKKTDDKIDFSSKLGINAFNKHWFYSSLSSFKTQMLPGYKYVNDSVLISDFLSPAYVLLSMGMDYKYKKFSLFAGPFTGKLTIVNNDMLAEQGAFGVSKGKNQRLEAGGVLKLAFQDTLVKNVTVDTKLELFSNYLENPQNIDVEWDVLMTFKVNKYISANLQTRLIYDHDTKIEEDDGSKAPQVQFKEIFGIGFAYDF